MEEAEQFVVVVQSTLGQVSVIDCFYCKHNQISFQLPVKKQFFQRRNNSRSELLLDPQERIPQKVKHQPAKMRPTLAPQTRHIRLEMSLGRGRIQQHFV